MTPSEILERVLTGRCMLVGTLRNARLWRDAAQDAASGAELESVSLLYLVETDVPSRTISIFREVAASDAETMLAKVKKGERYVFELWRLAPRENWFSAQLTHREPELIEPDVAPQSPTKISLTL